MGATIKKIFICETCGSVVSSGERPLHCPKCSSKFNNDAMDTLGLLWAKSPMTIKTDIINKKIGEALERNEADKEINKEVKSRDQVEAPIRKSMETTWTKFLLETQKEEISSTLKTIQCVYDVAHYTPSRDLVLMLIQHSEVLAKQTLKLKEMVASGSAFIDTKKLYEIK